jgi:hypothetical protein
MTRPTETQVAWLECFAGISGDMLMGALIDAGAPLEPLRHAIAMLGLDAELQVSKTDRSGIQATKVAVLVHGRLAESEHGDHRHDHDSDHGRKAQDHESHDHAEHHHGTARHSHGDGEAGRHRNLASIRAILAAAPLNGRARDWSLRAFEVLAEAEGKVHGISAEEVHFHEVGAVDAIVDIVGCSVAADLLGLERWYASPVNVGGGFVECAHGRYPAPAPATAALLLQAPVYSAGPAMEMTTPTGAALLRALDCRFESPGVLRSSAIGYGAGTRNPSRFPNVLRLTLGEVASGDGEKTPGFGDEKVMVIECAIDDLNPQVLAYTAQLAMERGALDVMTAPVTMKKGRLGTLLTVLCRPADAAGLEQLLFRETSTLGMRVREESRLALTRETASVETEFGVIRVKVGRRQGEEMNAAPEFEDCRRAAEARDVPLKTVMQAALAEWRRNSPARSRNEG